MFNTPARCRQYGIKKFSHNVQRSIHRRNLVRRIELLTERRHNIVHEGDLNSHGGLRSIRADEVESQLKDLKKFVNAAESLSAKILK